MNRKITKKAIITGITGQDGSYLAEFLLSKGYEVHGIIRRASTFNTARIDHFYIDPHDPDARIFLHFGDLSDAEQINNLIYNIKPDEIYHLGSQSHVRVSFDIPEYTGNVTALGTVRLLEAIRHSKSRIKLYQASSSEMFGAALPPQSENTAFQPQSPYACAKAYAYWMVKNYRDGYGMFACNGILFNHESPRRGETFVTRKISRGLAAILAGKQNRLYMGNLDAKRDWGFAPEYVEAMWMMLQRETADDYVIGTAESHSVRDFIEKAFDYAGIKIVWKGKGLNEKGVIEALSPDLKDSIFLKKGSILIEIDKDYFRPNEVHCLCADIGKARDKLGWEPGVTFDSLVKIMVDADMEKAGLKPPGEGLKVYRQGRFGYIDVGVSFAQSMRGRG